MADFTFLVQNNKDYYFPSPSVGPSEDDTDPLSDCSDFNIIQFCNENDTSVDSPGDPNRYPQQCVQNRPNPGMLSTGGEMMYQSATRLPDSPPITDISGAASSGSPSSTSDSPYSPENYQNYQVVHNQQNNNGLILGVHPDLTSQMLVQNDLIPQGHRLNNRIMQHTLPSPQSEFMESYTGQSTPAAISQVSPSPINARPIGNGYLISNNGYQLDAYNGMIPVPPETIQHPPVNEGPVNRKRIRTDAAPLHIKNEPQKVYALPSQLSIVPSPITTKDFEDGFHQRAIRFSRFMEDQWAPLYDCNRTRLEQLEMHVVADKGFNYSNMDNCFVNQKKNHFQITVHIEAFDNQPPNYVKIGERLLQVREFNLVFRGVRSEMLTSEIEIKQSTTDRKPIPHEPVKLAIQERRMTKVTVHRLHFSETTANNQRKNGRPNPDQKYFLLIVKLIARTDGGEDPIVQAYQSEKVIVRASNPGQFEPPDADTTWQRNGSTLYYNSGFVAIGTDKTVAPLTVAGDIFCSGTVKHASDRRVKENIQEIDTKDALSRLEKIRVVEYAYKPEIADEWGLSEESRHRVGVIAQELAEILPEAVTDNGDYLQVDDSRIFYETVAAATELCKLTGSLETKITAVEKLSHKLARLHRQRCKDAGSIASGLTEFDLSDKSASASRISLTSTAASCVSHDKNYNRKKRDRLSSISSYHHCHNPACQRSDPPLCSSKLTQFTTVALFIVMAICLLAMSTLYVLDWHRRNSTYYNYLPNITSTEENDPGLSFIFKPNEPYKAPDHSKAPPLTVYCGTDHCRMYCCADLQGSDTENSSSEAISSLSTSLLGERTLALARYTSLSIAKENNEQLSTDSASPLPSGVTIEVLNLNVSLDARYCLNTSCNSRRGSYTLYIPITPYLPTVSLEVKISVPDSRLFVANCGIKYPRKCKFNDSYSQDEPVSYMITDGVYELPVGNYLHILHRFRIGYIADSCEANEAQKGRSYDEYNLVFYRLCKDLQLSDENEKLNFDIAARGEPELLNKHNVVSQGLLNSNLKSM